MVPENPRYTILGSLAVLTTFFIWKGLMIIQPNHARVLSFFGKYIASVKDNGLFFINPLYASTKISQRMQNLQTPTLKVNDKMGNPIEIGAVIVWQVNKRHLPGQLIDVSDFSGYIKTQSESALPRHYSQHLRLRPYRRRIVRRSRHCVMAERKVNELLEAELNERLSQSSGLLDQQGTYLPSCVRAGNWSHASTAAAQLAGCVAARSKIVGKRREHGGNGPAIC
jgi:regulator of protease activity HflC (stomatin/prohibitin superfamily)